MFWAGFLVLGLEWLFLACFSVVECPVLSFFVVFCGGVICGAVD